MLVHFLTFSGMGRNPDGTWNTWKSLTCPSCGKRTRAVAVKAQPGEAAARPRRTSRVPGAPRGDPATRRARPQRRGGRKR